METGVFALIIAILGCDVKEQDLEENEEQGMRRYPITAEDAFKCYAGNKYKYESKHPEYYNINDRYRYKEHSSERKIV